MASVSWSSLVALVALAVLPACTGGGGGGDKIACVNAIDCDVDEACRGGFCGPNEAVDGGVNPDAGTSGGDEASAIAAICQRVSSCSDPTQTQSCIEQTTEQFQQLHDLNTDICEKVAADLVEFYTCAGSATCDELNDSTRLSARCPIFDQIQNEFDQCQGAGEGEGEPPPPPDRCFVSDGFDPNATTDAIFLDDVFGTVDSTANPNCETAFSATLQIDFEGDPDGAAALVGESIASFDQVNVFDALPPDFSEPGVIRVVACGDDVSLGFVAFQLLLVDGTHSNAVCGSLSFP
jgi:hypothetical protein